MLNHRGILTLIRQHIIVFTLVFMKKLIVTLHHLATNRQHIVKIDQKLIALLLLESLVFLQYAFSKRDTNFHFCPFIARNHFIFDVADICRQFVHLIVCYVIAMNRLIDFTKNNLLMQRESLSHLVRQSTSAQVQFLVN
ncbi:hypothetical protein D3C78_1200950 [compost metagenome]